MAKPSCTAILMWWQSDPTTSKTPAGAGLRVSAARCRMIYSAPMVYDVETPLVLNGIQFGSIRVGISTVFLKNEITHLLQKAAVYCCIAVLVGIDPRRLPIPPRPRPT
jgi:hypothetical protein